MTQANNHKVLIIGSGAAGAAVAWSLSRANLEVACLEQGTYMDAAKYPATRKDWELSRQKEFHFSPNVRNLASDYPINDRQSAIAISNYNAVGGSTILYSGHYPRFHPSDFRVKALDGVAADWPIDYWQLEPYFAENEKMMGVSGIAGDPWLGEHLGLQAGAKALAVLERVFGDKYLTLMQVRSWGNIPILNELRAVQPERDAVALYEQLWQTRLVCPGGGTYQWNDQWHSYESTVYGHPGQPRKGDAVPPVLRRFIRGNSGVTFENDGLRARARFERKSAAGQ